MSDYHRLIVNERQMQAFGARLFAACESGGIIALQGDLGTGKTTLVRGALASQGVNDGVRSPTYTLVEFYELETLSIAHFDLYRLADTEELEYLGFRDYLNDDTLCFIEWPERSARILGDIGLVVQLEYVSGGRQLNLMAHTDWARRIIIGLMTVA